MKQSMQNPMAPTPEQSAIHIKVDEVSQLFNTLDPFPFRERDLDRDAEDFIVGWARELPRQRPIHVVIHATAATVQHIGDAAIADALNRYFTYRAESASLELNELFRQGRLSLFIGLMVLAICLMANRAVDALFGPGQVGRYLGEGLIILGWVANWKPMEIFLYDWWPLAKRRNLYRRLGRATVSVQIQKKAPPDGLAIRPADVPTT